jgi:hypothetical protein
MKFYGIDGLRKSELQDALERGGRFVHYQYAFSILIMTFKRASSVHFIRPGEGTFFKSLKYSLFTFLYGWWGIPWGPIYSATSLFHNMSGGLDVTAGIRKVIEGLDDEQVARLPRARGFVGYAALLLPLLGLAWMFSVSGREEAARAAVPGYASFKAKDDSIDSYKGKDGFGNNLKAAGGAIKFATTVKSIRDLAITGKDEHHLSMSEGHFLTFIDVSHDSIGLIVHVPRLRKYEEDAKRMMEDVIWRMAVATAREQLDSAHGVLLVGVRGISAYDKVWVMNLADTTRAEMDPVRDAGRFYAFFD